MRIPKIVWILWHQGWAHAPGFVQEARESWRTLNPGWSVQALDANSLRHFLPAADLSRIAEPQCEIEAFSDRVRIELLHRYGGVWVDATTLCLRPLDQWLPARLSSGFFAFANPGEGRLLSSWFLAAQKGHYIVDRWRQRTIEYWTHRNRRDDYFWFHHLFSDECARDESFKRIWDATSALPAAHAGHFGANDGRLVRTAAREDLELLSSPPSPVFKLTRKLPATREPNALIDVILDEARSRRSAVTVPAPAPRRLLVAWYGSFAGHGTIGDLRSLESVVTHLVGRGHRVMHATASRIEIPGARRIDWRRMDPWGADAVLFVCGPILSSHPETKELFRHFGSARLLGVGVSLLPKGHENYANPFEHVLARQGGDGSYGDLAIAAPMPSAVTAHRAKGPVVGIALRGHQSDYGSGVCKAEEVAALVDAIATSVVRGGGRTVPIENHLTRSGVSADAIEGIYGDCDLVITSRFHGAVAALRAGVPFIAIDQIVGGAKVYDLLVGLGWPHVYRIDRLDPAVLHDAARKLLAEPNREALMRARQGAVAEANRTLDHLDEWISSLPARTSPFGWARDSSRLLVRAKTMRESFARWFAR